jgi:type II secretory pathway pseudopilin PulG
MRKLFVTQSQTTSHAKRGFLLVELVIGLVIVALVMLGAAAIMGAVAQGWNDQDVTRSTQLQANQTYVRVQNALEGAKYVGYWNAGSMDGSSSPATSIFFWQNDNFGGVETGDPCIGEMALIQFDPTTNTLWLYKCLSPSQMNGSQQTQAAQVWTLSDIDQSSYASQFTPQNYSFVQKQALGGPGEQADDGTRLKVLSFGVNVSSLSSTTQLPVIEYAIHFQQTDGTKLALYNTTTIRGPATQPQ